MADLKVKISEFPLATESKDTDDFAILQDGENKRIKSPKLEEKLLVKVDDRYVNKNKLGENNGVATLGSDGFLSVNQRPPYNVQADFLPINLLSAPSEVDGVFVPTESGIYGNYGNIEIDLNDGTYIITKIGEQYEKSLLAVQSPKSVNTISELRSREGDFEGQIINLLGYYEAGDKEPLNYKWTSEQGVDDGGSVINTENGSWLAIFYNSLNIIDFGAKSDNITDDINAFRKSLNYASLNNKELIISKNTYIGSYVDVPSNSVIKCLSNVHIKTPTGLSEFNGVFRCDGVLTSVTSNLTIDSLEGSNVIYVANASLFNINEYIFISQNESSVKSRNQYTDELALIKEIDFENNKITIENSLGHEYNTTRVALITKCNAVTNVNIDINVNGNEEDRRVHIVLAKYNANSTIKVNAYNYGGSGIKLHFAYKCNAIDSNFSKPMNPSLGGRGYGVDLAGASYCNVSNIIGYACRHTIELTTGSHHNIIRNAKSFKSTNSAIGSHGMNCKYNYFYNAYASEATDAFSTVNSEYNIDFDHYYIDCVAENCTRGFVGTANTENLTLINPTTRNCATGINIVGKNCVIENPNIINSTVNSVVVGGSDGVNIKGGFLQSDSVTRLLDIRDSSKNIYVDGTSLEAVTATGGVRVGVNSSDLTTNIKLSNLKIGKKNTIGTRDIDIQCGDVNITDCDLNRLFVNADVPNLIAKGNNITTTVDIRTSNYVFEGNFGNYTISTQTVRPTFTNKSYFYNNIGVNLNPKPKGVNYLTNANLTLTVGSSAEVQILDIPLTANRTITLSTTGGIYTGATFTIKRTLNSNDVNTLTITTTPPSTLISDKYITVVYDGVNWIKF